MLTHDILLSSDFNSFLLRFEWSCRVVIVAILQTSSEKNRYTNTKFKFKILVEVKATFFINKLNVTCVRRLKVNVFRKSGYFNKRYFVVVHMIMRMQA